eukprot:392277-Pleurochrysis_carterae.AAC.1
MLTDVDLLPDKRLEFSLAAGEQNSCGSVAREKPTHRALLNAQSPYERFRHSTRPRDKALQKPRTRTDGR